VAARDLTGTTSIEIAPRERFELASLYKVVLMAEVMRQVKGGQRRLSDAVETLAEYDFGEPEGGVPPGTRLTVDEALAATIQVSSNAAALALIELIGAPALAAAPARFGMTDTTIEAQSLGKGHYWIDSLGSARDLVELLARIGRRQAVDAALDQRMADYLLGQRVDDRLPVGLPHSVRIAHKTGDDEDFTHDAGLVLLSRRPYAVAVLTQAESVAEGKSAIVEVSRLLYGYFSATA
jgi:beta-lactamase class A